MGWGFLGHMCLCVCVCVGGGGYLLLVGIFVSVMIYIAMNVWMTSYFNLHPLCPRTSSPPHTEDRHPRECIW